LLERFQLSYYQEINAIYVVFVAIWLKCAFVSMI